jgi:hypothetical protein
MESSSGPSSAFLLLSPLPKWKGVEQDITKEIRIRRLAPQERTALELSNTLLNHHGVTVAERDAWWVCYEFENPYPSDNVRYRRRQEAAQKLMLHAIYSIQILVPIGGTNLFLLYRKKETGTVLDSTQHRQAFIAPIWGRVCEVPATFGSEIGLVLDRLHDVFQKPTLRLQIPVWLMEQGFGAPDRHIRILLWATGLDGITRSGGMVAFAERLYQLLGADTYVFPPDAANRQPKYKVRDVAEDLYQLRNEMAHGLPFHERFRKKQGFLMNGGQPVAEEYAGYRYDQVLEECSVFLLCKALREIFVNEKAVQT